MDILISKIETFSKVFEVCSVSNALFYSVARIRDSTPGKPFEIFNVKKFKYKIHKKLLAPHALPILEKKSRLTIPTKNLFGLLPKE